MAGADTALVNQFYFYGHDSDFGPFFIKFGTYFPYVGRVYLNGHEWAKRQAGRTGLDFTALDNGFASCSDPEGLQRLARRLSAVKIEAFVRKWLARLPHPFTAADRRAGYRYQLSVLQAEFSLTQVLDRPNSGRVFFESVIRDNLDLGRPDQVSLVFDRRVVTRHRTGPTPGQFRTKVVTDGVTPSLHVCYKNSKIKQYHKEGVALRTETTINDPHEFAIGKMLVNLANLAEIGFAANRRLLHVQRTSYDPWRGQRAFDDLTGPIHSDAGRAAGLRFGDPRVHALFSALVVFRLLPNGFANRDLRRHLAGLLGLPAESMTPGQMTYDLRRLRLHGLITRVPKTHRYRVTDDGILTATFLVRAYNRMLRPGLAVLGDPLASPVIKRALAQIDSAMPRDVTQFLAA